MLTLLTLMILEQLHGLERRRTTKEFVRELGLVIWLVIASILLIHLLMSLLSVVYGRISQQWLSFPVCQVKVGAVRGKEIAYPNRT